MQDLLLLFILGYGLGNFQTSYILTKLIKKVDIRTLGKGNAGASNTLESLGWKFGITVAFFDTLKGLLAVLIAHYIFGYSLDSQGAPYLYLAGYSAVIGHIFPFFMKFKGGKGTATIIGMIIGLNPWYGVIGIAILITTTFITDFVSLGTVSLLFWMIGITISFDIGITPLILAILISFLSIYLHLPNFRRIRNKEESRLSVVLKRRKTQ